MHNNISELNTNIRRLTNVLPVAHLLAVSVVQPGRGDGGGSRWQSGGGPVEAVCSGEVTALGGQWQGPAHLGRGGVYLGPDAHPQRHGQPQQEA